MRAKHGLSLSILMVGGVGYILTYICQIFQEFLTDRYGIQAL